MGDRTFSAEDVIRIYQFFLTTVEQETVDKFFEEMAAEPTRDNFFVDLEIIQSRVTSARVPLPGLFGLVLRFVPFAATLVDTISFQLTQANILIQRLLLQEEVDA